MDRLKEYFTGRLSELLFVELSDEFVEKAGATSYLKGVPVPIRKDDLPGFAGGAGLEVARLGERMALVIGCDLEFKYRDSYLAFLSHAFDANLKNVMLARAAKAADDGHHKDACIEFRSALAVDENDPAAILGYARACQDVYLESEDDEEIGNFKAESVEYFESMTLKHPEVAVGHYYLGYAYVNMGLYIKAKIAWEEFLKLNHEGSSQEAENSGQNYVSEVEEIQSRLEQLKDPVVIEEGCNHIIAGRYEQGIDILKEYRRGDYSGWWPLHFYLGTAYRELGDMEEAIALFKSVLALNASHIDSMQELSELYHEIGDVEMEQKYRKKLMIIKSQKQKTNH